MACGDLMSATSYTLLNWAHVLVMGYWIGSDLVVNQLTHYIARSASLPPAERKRLWDLLIHVDQHPRNALILSVPIGFTLAALLGLMPLGRGGLVLLWLASAAWFGFMWLTHVRREAPSGPALARLDWRSRHVLIAAFLAIGVLSLATGAPLQAPWLAWKAILFAGVLACGIGIRFYIADAYRAWPRIWAGQGNEADEATVRAAMRRGTYVLWLLWALLVAIGWLGAVKPA
jgi:hypothetical protein